VNFVQKVDVLNEEVEHRDDDLLTAAVGHLGSLRGPLQGRAVVAEVAGWVHVVLGAQGRLSKPLPTAENKTVDGEGIVPKSPRSQRREQ
jgi:hypothetical protein